MASLPSASLARLLRYSVVLFSALASVCLGAPPDRIQFNRDVRPILAENCFYCHGQDSNKREADLRLDHREQAIEHGAIDPAMPANSTMLQRIMSTDADTQMPPPESNRHLTAEQKQTLQQWLEQGADYTEHWAFITPERPSVPADDFSNWARNPIDHFVARQLSAHGLSPSPAADRQTLIKRLYADLLGLPPTPQQVEQFVQDNHPNAYENLVDQLLKNPHYGERMALPWLDAARYADSNGFQQDGDSWQWMWRDWVVRALNDNLPFDQFVTWQLAGDLLPDATIDQQIASGFNRNHLLNGEGGAIPEEQRFVILFDRMDTTGTTFLGMTVACGQCHDHKYDPLTQRDYYSLMDAFNRVPETGTPQFFSKRIRVGKPFVEVPTEEVRQREAELNAKIVELEQAAQPLVDAAYHGWRTGILAARKIDSASEISSVAAEILSKNPEDRSDQEKQTLDAVLRKQFDQKVQSQLGQHIPVLSELAAVSKQRSDYLNDQMPRPMIMSDAQPRETHILTRGEYTNPGDKVSFATPAFLPPMDDQWPKNRLGLAKWLVDPAQPLMSRVQVNRLWQHFFGIGIVKTAEDFGVQSEYPIHLDLLDWLAVEFRESGWDMKKLNRLIVTSATYQQSSKVTPEMLATDPENRLYTRAARFRMPSMILRDWALAASDCLEQSIGGRPVYPYQPDGIWESLAITKERDFTYPQSSGNDLYRRSLYTFWRRTVGPANMFDASSRQTCKVRTGVTSTPLHALTTLNDPTWVEAGRILAQLAMQHSSDLATQIDLVFRRVLCRSPKSSELARLEQAFRTQQALFRQDELAAEQYLSVGAAERDQTLSAVDHAALAAVCLAIFNLDEALTRQ